MVSYPIPVTTISTPFLFFFLQQHFYSFPLVFQHLTLLPSKITYPHHSLGITPQLHIFYIWPFLPLYSVLRSLFYYTTALLSSSILHYFAVMPCGLYYASTLLLPTSILHHFAVMLSLSRGLFFATTSKLLLTSPLMLSVPRWLFYSSLNHKAAKVKPVLLLCTDVSAQPLVVDSSLCW